MLHALSNVRPGVLLLGAAIAVGAYAVRDAETARPRAVPAPSPRTVAAAPVVRAAPPPSLDTVGEDEGEEVDDDAIEDVTEELNGLAPLDGPADFAMMFWVDGTPYLRLSDSETATSHGRVQLIHQPDYIAAVAAVTKSALPAELRSWAGRTVFVDGKCQAKVVGFAEVSRVSGDPPGTDEWYYQAEEEQRGEKPEWNLENVRAANITLAAKLDGVGDCDGMWARATELAPAVIAHAVDASELETKALGDLFMSYEVESQQQSWTEMGAEGKWTDSADIRVTTWMHPESGERWIFAQASAGGDGCGSPSADAMAVYRAGDDGKLRKVTTMRYAYSTIRSVVDIDADGQPELLLGEGESTDLVDLKNENHGSISMPYYTWGCGC
jgi:hypothetical protein